MNRDNVIAAYKRKHEADLEEIRECFCSRCAMHGDPEDEKCANHLVYIGDFSIDGCDAYEKETRKE